MAYLRLGYCCRCVFFNSYLGIATVLQRMYGPPRWPSNASEWLPNMTATYFWFCNKNGKWVMIALGSCSEAQEGLQRGLPDLCTLQRALTIPK